jgi:hypothetical protein
VGRVVEPQEPLSTLELTVLGVGSLLSRRPIPWRSAAKGMEGGANAIRSDAAPSGTVGNNGFLTKEDCAAQGRSDLAALLHQLEETTKSWVTILIPKINAESTRLEITHLKFHSGSGVDRRIALPKFLKIIRDMGMSVKIDRLE